MCEDEILRQTSARGVKEAEHFLGRSVTLLGSPTIPLFRLGTVLGYALSAVVKSYGRKWVMGPEKAAYRGG